MTPVINPWIFYLMSVVDSIGCVACIALIICLITLGGYLLWLFVYCFEGINKSFLTKLVIASVALSVVCSFIPSSNTITKMLIAQNVTYERVEVATDTVQSVYEDIMGLFDEEVHHE